MLLFKSIKTLSDEQLMEKAKGGSVRAQEEIYRRYSKPLLRYFYRMLWQDKERAEDFLHDLFVKILEKPSYFDEKCKFSTWIYSVAHNLCKNEYRKRAHRESFTQSQEQTVHIYNSERLDQQSFRNVLDKILKEEGDEAATLFTLRYELDKSFSEIGEILQCPENTARTRLFYLKKKLSNSLHHFKVILEK